MLILFQVVLPAVAAAPKLGKPEFTNKDKSNIHKEYFLRKKFVKFTYLVDSDLMSEPTLDATAEDSETRLSFTLPSSWFTSEMRAS